MTHKCERYGEPLKEPVWLELDWRDNSYHVAGEVPEQFSQGAFPFGPDCAKKVRK